MPYLNAKPLIEWFHSDDCTMPVEVEYSVPSDLAGRLAAGHVDAALVSTFELFNRPELRIIPGIAIGADGPVESVRIFSKVPFASIKSIAMDSSSLTSVALSKILMAEMYGHKPHCETMAPDPVRMLEKCDAALIIGDLHIFETQAAYQLDLGAAWKELTGLPFVYALWLAPESAPLSDLTAALRAAMRWGLDHLDQLTARWSIDLALPTARVKRYFRQIMRYELDDSALIGVRRYRELCIAHGLAPDAPIPALAD